MGWREFNKIRLAVDIPFDPDPGSNVPFDPDPGANDVPFDPDAKSHHLDSIVRNTAHAQKHIEEAEKNTPFLDKRPAAKKQVARLAGLKDRLSKVQGRVPKTLSVYPEPLVKKGGLTPLSTVTYHLDNAAGHISKAEEHSAQLDKAARNVKKTLLSSGTTPTWKALWAKEQLAARVESLSAKANFLTAAVSTGAQFDRAKQLADSVSPAVEQIYDRWSTADFQHNTENLQKFSDELTEALNADLNHYTDAVARSLRSRGLLKGLTQDQIDTLTSDAAAHATSPVAVKDLFSRLNNAAKDPDDAMGRFTGPQNAYNRSTHVGLNASDKLIQDVTDLQIDNGLLTGRRQWKSDSPDSRSADLDGNIAEADQGFQVADDLGGISEIDGPRPTGGEPGRWSNSHDALLFETDDGRFI